MKKIEFKKREYLKPEIAWFQVENCLLAGSPGWNDEEKEEGGFGEDPDEDPFGGGK